MGSQETAALDGIQNWITINVPKLDVYRAAKGLTLDSSTESSIFDINRLVEFNQGNIDRNRIFDKYIFLAFIQSLEADLLNKSSFK
jgi:hypothetical protein